MESTLKKMQTSIISNQMDIATILRECKLINYQLTDVSDIKVSLERRENGYIITLPKVGGSLTPPFSSF